MPRRSTQKETGLRLTGIVVDRKKRRVPFDNPTTEVVTYVIADGQDRNHYVDDFAPSDYHDIGSEFSREVYVKPYRKRDGNLSYTLCVKKDFQSRGESF